MFTNLRTAILFALCLASGWIVGTHTSDAVACGGYSYNTGWVLYGATGYEETATATGCLCTIMTDNMTFTTSADDFNPYQISLCEDDNTLQWVVWQLEDASSSWKLAGPGYCNSSSECPGVQTTISGVGKSSPSLTYFDLWTVGVWIY